MCRKNPILLVLLHRTETENMVREIEGSNLLQLLMEQRFVTLSHALCFTLVGKTKLISVLTNTSAPELFCSSLDSYCITIVFSLKM